MPERAEPKVVYPVDMEVTDRTPIGVCVEWECPDCGWGLRVFPLQPTANVTKCKCREWNLLFEARDLGIG